VAYEYREALRDELNKKLKTGNTKIKRRLRAAAARPAGRALTEGRVTWSIAQVTIRPELQALVDFTQPTRHQRQRGRRDGPAPRRSPRPTTCREGRLRAQGQQVLRERRRPEREAQGGRQSARRHQGDPGQPRGRRRARDGQRRPHSESRLSTTTWRVSGRRSSRTSRSTTRSPSARREPRGAGAQEQPNSRSRSTRSLRRTASGRRSAT